MDPIVKVTVLYYGVSESYKLLAYDSLPHCSNWLRQACVTNIDHCQGVCNLAGFTQNRHEFAGDNILQLGVMVGHNIATSATKYIIFWSSICPTSWAFTKICRPYTYNHIFVGTYTRKD